MNISTHKTEYFILESKEHTHTHTHIRNSQPYQLHISTQALTGIFNKYEKYNSSDSTQTLNRQNTYT